jgi:hypothetical protein
VLGASVGVGTVTTFRLPWILWKSLCASTAIGKSNGTDPDTHTQRRESDLINYESGQAILFRCAALSIK